MLQERAVCLQMNGQRCNNQDAGAKLVMSLQPEQTYVKQADMLIYYRMK